MCMGLMALQYPHHSLHIVSHSPHYPLPPTVHYVSGRGHACEREEAISLVVSDCTDP